MIAPDLIKNLFVYYSRFVANDVLKNSVVQLNRDKSAGYDELVAELLSRSDKPVIAELQRYYFSINEDFVSDGIRNGRGYLLFVEYGQTTIDKDTAEQYPAATELRITVAHEHTKANRDAVEEVLIMQKTLDILNRIVDILKQEQSSLDSCGNPVRLEFPCQLIPLDPVSFFDHAGWVALFNHQESDV